MFDNEHRRYCLPVLSPHIITCEQLAFNRDLASTYDEGDGLGSRVQWIYMDMNNSVTHKAIQNDGYQISIDYNHDWANGTFYRINDENQGTMVVAQSPLPSQVDTTILTASDSGGKGYASLLYEMMNGQPPPNAPHDYKFVAKCTIPSVEGKNPYTSWQWVDMLSQGGILQANVSGQTCDTPWSGEHTGFLNLRYAIAGAASIASGSDGYTKLLNLNDNEALGSPFFKDQNRLEAALNQLYHIIQTSWSQIAYKEAMAESSVGEHPIQLLDYAHLLVIRVSWTPTTWIGLGIAIALAITSVVTFARWLQATGCIRADEESWNLLRPVDLMAYSLAAHHDLAEDLNSIANRKAALSQKPAKILREYPIENGTDSFLDLVKSASPRTPRTTRTQHSVPSSGSTAFSPLLRQHPSPDETPVKYVASGGLGFQPHDEGDPFGRGT